VLIPNIRVGLLLSNERALEHVSAGVGAQTLLPKSTTPKPKDLNVLD